MLAHQCHVWQQLCALREETPDAINPAGSKGDLIKHMQIKEVLKNSSSSWGSYVGTSDCVSSVPVVLVVVV